MAQVRLMQDDTANRMSSNEKGSEVAEAGVDTEVRPRYDKGPPKWRSQRFILGYYVCVGMANIFFQRVNMSIAIVCMVNHTAISSHKHYSPSIEFGITNGTFPPIVAVSNSSSLGIQPAENFTSRSSQSYQSYDVGSDVEEREKDETQDIKNTKEKEEKREPETNGRCSAEDLVEEKKEDGPFAWPKQEQGLLLGAIYWTYLLFSIPGNHLVRNFRRKTVILVSMAILTATTMLSPVAAHWSLWALFVLRLVHGACTAVAIVALYGMWTVWAPPRERGGLLTFNLSGIMLSNIAVFPVSAVLCKYGFLGGWPSVFYVFGLFSFAWLVLFAVFVEESPSTSRFITEGEKNYILGSLSHSGGHAQFKTPWKAIITSRAMWAVVFLHVSFGWNYFTFLSTLPQYMNEILKMDIQSNGVFSMVPYISLLVVTYISGPTTDWVTKRGFLPLIWIRRISVLFANLVPAVCLCVLSYLDCTHTGLIIILLVFGVGMTGLAMITQNLVPYDVAPRFAPAMVSFSNTFATIAGIVTPLVVAAIAKDQTREQWQMVFFLTAGILVVGAVGFCLLAQGEVQKWAMLEKGGSVENGFNQEFEVEMDGGDTKDIVEKRIKHREEKSPS